MERNNKRAVNMEERRVNPWKETEEEDAKNQSKERQARTLAKRGE